MNWMDVCVIIIITISALKGLSTGLVLTLFNTASYIVAAIIAKIYYSTVANFIVENTDWFFKIQEFVLKNINFNNNLETEGASHQEVFEMMNLPKGLGDLFLKNDILKEHSQGVLHDINIYISQAVAKTVVDILSIIIIFFIAKIALNILGAVLNGMAALPIINQFNRLGGLIFGALKGVFIVYIFTAIMVPVASIFPNSYLITTLQTSSIVKTFYDYNILLYMIKNIINGGSSQLLNGFNSTN